jgi:hypothetical protein
MVERGDIIDSHPTDVGADVELSTRDSNQNPNLTQKEATMTQIRTTNQGSKQADDKNSIRPFHANVPESDLSELRRRINATISFGKMPGMLV